MIHQYEEMIISARLLVEETDYFLNVRREKEPLDRLAEITDIVGRHRDTVKAWGALERCRLQVHGDERLDVLIQEMYQAVKHLEEAIVEMFLD